MKKRVVVTGMAGISPLGNDWPTIRARLGEYRNAIVHMEDWVAYEGLNTQLGAPAAPFELGKRYDRKSIRSMGRVALLATRATELALADAGLLDHPLLKSGQMGISFGSSAGTPSAIGFAARDCFGGGPDEVGVVDGVRAVRAEVTHVMPQVPQHGLDAFLVLEARVIAGDGDSHV